MQALPLVLIIDPPRFRPKWLTLGPITDSATASIISTATPFASRFLSSSPRIAQDLSFPWFCFERAARVGWMRPGDYTLVPQREWCGDPALALALCHS